MTLANSASRLSAGRIHHPSAVLPNQRAYDLTVRGQGAHGRHFIVAHEATIAFDIGAEDAASRRATKDGEVTAVRSSLLIMNNYSAGRSPLSMDLCQWICMLCDRSRLSAGIPQLHKQRRR